MFQIFKKIFSFFYFLIYSLNRFFFRLGLKKVFSSPAYILSIGNLSLGGSGKTPMVEFVSKELYLKNFSPTIISRGYGRGSRKNLMVSDGGGKIASIEASGDEPYMLANSLPQIPIWVGKKTQVLFSAYEKNQPKPILLDDGFQTAYIKKNLDILLIDTSVSLAQYQLLPVGRLREPLSAINRANIIILTKCNFAGKNLIKIKKIISSYLYNKKTSIFSSNYVLALKQYKKNTFFCVQKNFSTAIVAFCGIANSKIFEKEASRLSGGPFAFLKFSDHHRYSNKDIVNIKQTLALLGSQTIITTKKDLFKIKDSLKNYNLFILDVEHQIINKAGFLKEIVDDINNYYSSDQYIG